MPDQNPTTIAPNEEESSSVQSTQSGVVRGTNTNGLSFKDRCKRLSLANPLIIAALIGIAGLITLQLTHADEQSIKKVAPVQSAKLTAAQPIFSWKPVAPNASYEIQIYFKGNDSRTSAPPLIDTMISSTQFAPAKPLNAGNYSWRVRSNQPKTTWSTTWQFNTTATDITTTGGGGGGGGTGGGGGGGGGTGGGPGPGPGNGGGGGTEGAITPTPGAVSVKNFGATGAGTADDTAAFVNAIAAASASSVKYAASPTGQPQGVVYVPAGTYRLQELAFSPNIRMEVDANAVLEAAGGIKTSATTLIRWDGAVGHPLTNVSLVGVGSGTNGLKAKANPVASGRSIDNSFSFDLDAADTAASNKMSGLIVMNTQGFLVENVYSVQNDFLPAAGSTGSNIAGTYPTTQKAALVLRARTDSPCSGPFAQPVNGTISNWYNVHGPKGYGPNQIGAGQNIVFNHIFSQGGTTLRLETDSSEPSNGGTACPGGKTKFGSTIRGLIGTDIEGLDCNRAVAFVPHLQDNYDVNVSGVLSTNCSQTVIESKSPMFHLEGSFNNSTITNVKSVGSGSSSAQQLAQNGTSGAVVGGWSIGKSKQAFARDNGLAWWITYTNPVTCQGEFQQGPSTLHNASGTFVPSCTQ